LGQDVSIVFAPGEVAPEQLLDAATRAFAQHPPSHLAILYSREGPTCVKEALPTFTSASLWADAEEGLALFASELSRLVNKVLVVTMADHSCVGGWQLFENGERGEGAWQEGEGYTQCGIQGIEQCFDVQLRPTEEERLWFVERFLAHLAGIWVFGSAGRCRPGGGLHPGQIQAIMEFDLPEAELECLLLAG
jgi:hypothetical protein